MLSTEVARSDACELHLVITGGVEADRVGSCRQAGDAAEHAGNGGTVGPAAEKAADARRIERADLGTHRRLDVSAKLALQIGERPIVAFVERRRPVGLHRQLPAFEAGAMAWWQTLHAAQDRARRRYDVEEQVVEDGLGVDIGDAVGQRICARREAQALAVDAVTQRARREAVDGEERAAALVAQRDRKITGHRGRCSNTALCEGEPPCRDVAFPGGQRGKGGIGKARPAAAEIAAAQSVWSEITRCHGGRRLPRSRRCVSAGGASRTEGRCRFENDRCTNGGVESSASCTAPTQRNVALPQSMVPSRAWAPVEAALNAEMRLNDH